MDAEGFHAKLNAILDEPDMTLKKLAEMSGIPYKTLTNIRSAKSLPDRSNYLKLINALGMSAFDFANGSVNEIVDKSRDYRMTKTIEGLNGYQKKMACALLETIKSVEL